MSIATVLRGFFETQPEETPEQRTERVIRYFRGRGLRSCLAPNTDCEYSPDLVVENSDGVEFAVVVREKLEREEMMRYAFHNERSGWVLAVFLTGDKPDQQMQKCAAAASVVLYQAYSPARMIEIIQGIKKEE